MQSEAFYCETTSLNQFNYTRLERMPIKCQVTSHTKKMQNRIFILMPTVTINPPRIRILIVRHRVKISIKIPFSQMPRKS